MSQRSHRDHEDSGMSVELTIVMPCLNEAETLETCITESGGVSSIVRASLEKL